MRRRTEAPPRPPKKKRTKYNELVDVLADALLDLLVEEAAQDPTREKRRR